MIYIYVWPVFFVTKKFIWFGNMIEIKVERLYSGLLLLNQMLNFYKYLLYLSAPAAVSASFLNGGSISVKENIFKKKLYMVTVC